MKFVSSKKITDYARRLYEVQEERERIMARLKDLDAEIEGLETFIQARRPDGFQFADDKGYLMVARIVPGSRENVDLRAVRRDYAKRGKTVPMKTSTWTHVQTSYVVE